MKALVTFLVFLCALIFVVPAQAQHYRMGYGTGYGSLSVPVGDFGDDTGQKAGLADIGLGMGLEYSQKLGYPGWTAVFSAFLIANPLDEDELPRGAGQLCYDDTCYDIDIHHVDAGSYLNVPLLAGLRYRDMRSPYGFFITGLVGLNLMQHPEVDWDIDFCEASEDCYRARIESTYDLATSLAFGAEVGAVIQHRTVLSVRYLWLGEPNVEGTDNYYYRHDGLFRSERYHFDAPTSMLLFNIGYRF